MSDQNNERQPASAIMAKAGMTISLITFMLVILFYGLLLPLLPVRPEAPWPGAVVIAGYVLLVLVPAGFVLSGLGLAGIARHGRKGILAPGLIGLLLSLLVGIPFCSGFISEQVRHNRATQPAATASASASATVFARGRTTASAPGASRAVGVFIPAPERADMVHDPKRNLLYITAGDSVLRYQLASNIFLPPLVLGGNLRGIDISLDNDLLAVADGTEYNGRIGIYVVDLKTGTNSHVMFRAETLESGTYSVAFGADGGVWVTSSLNGSGFVPLRKYTPATHSSIQMQSVTQDTMLAASANREMIGFAEADISSGDYGRIHCRDTRLPPTMLHARSFIYEIGISRDGTQMAVPSHQNVILSGATVTQLDEPDVIGVAYHPQRDFVFLVWSGMSIVAAYETGTYTKVKELDFGEKFNSTGNRAFQSGRLRLSADGAWLFCTVNGGIRYAATGLD